MSIHSIIKTLRETQGTNNKLAILKENVGNEELKDFLRLVYEPTINYYMSDIPAEALPGDFDTEEPNMTAVTYLALNLSSRILTGFAAKQHVILTARRSNRATVDLIKILLNRDIKCGIATTAVNKTWPGLVKVVPYQRCVLPKDSNMSNWAWGTPGFFAYSQLKKDGMYANLDVNGMDVAVTSRQGSVFPDGKYFQHLKDDARAIASSMNHVGGTQLQGELLVKKDGAIMARAEGNGLLNSILQSGEEIGPQYEITMAVWDAIPLSEATSKNKYLVPYKVRFPLLQAAVMFAKDSISLVETKIIRTYREGVDHLLDALRRKEEGTIMKHMDAIWLDGDNKDQIKGKLEFTVELMITGFKPGDQNGQHANTFGSLQGQSSEGLLEAGVSGFPQKTRDDLWARRDFYLGKIISVTANDITFSTDGGKTPHSLFLPRLTEIRLDKTTANSFAEIVAAMEAAKEVAELK